MKTTIKIVALSTFVFGLATSCKKEETQEAISQITTEDAADIIASSISSGSYGSTSDTYFFEEFTDSIIAIDQPCLYNNDTTFKIVNPVGSIITYNYDSKYSFQMYCTNTVLSYMQCNLNASGTISFPRMDANVTATGNLKITGLLPSDIEYIFNGTYNRTGTATSKIRAKNTFTYKLDLGVQNVKINKTTDLITSGTSTVSLNTTDSKGTSKSFNGNLTYVSPKIVSLVLNNTTYTIDLTNCNVN